VYEFGLLKKGTSLCHGISGNAFVFLKLYEITKDKSWLQKANNYLWFAKNRFDSLFSVPDSPCSLFIGIAGLLDFLHNFIQLKRDPENFNTKFPCLDI